MWFGYGRVLATLHTYAAPLIPPIVVMYKGTKLEPLDIRKIRSGGAGDRSIAIRSLAPGRREGRPSSRVESREKRRHEISRYCTQDLARSPHRTKGCSYARGWKRAVRERKSLSRQGYPSQAQSRTPRRYPESRRLHPSTQVFLLLPSFCFSLRSDHGRLTLDLPPILP
jgi:hypothetical protein